MSDGLLRRVLDQLAALAEAGGAVMWPLLAVGLLAWTLLLLRGMTLMAVNRAQRLRDVESTPGLDEISGALKLRLWKIALRRHQSIVDTLIVSAPLLGLLGTVNGMITTFDGLTTMTLFSASGGIAGGIAEALTTTQAGLLVAIPAFFANRIIGRQATKLEQRLDAIALEAGPNAVRCES